MARPYHDPKACHRAARCMPNLETERVLTMISRLLTRLTSRRVLNLALQGGGAHGAFTWGVLDALLEDGRFEFEGISGASAGAINATVLADGLLRGGRAHAREALKHLWTRIAESALPGMAESTATGMRLTPLARMALHWAQFLSPFQFNPLDVNPLRNVLHDLVDFKRLRQAARPRLFIAATRADTGGLRVFGNGELTVDTLLASTCLPTLHRAVEIDGLPYWDGAFAANPPLRGLIYGCNCRDTLLVQLAPTNLGPAPLSANAIRMRMLDLAFTSPLTREFEQLAEARAFAASSFLDAGRLGRRLLRTRLHRIAAPELLEEHGSDSRLTVHLPFFEKLRDCGRETTFNWLRAEARSVGQRSTLDPALP